MARNRHPGTCYRCGKRVETGQGHFERHQGKWRVQHAECAIKHRGTNKHFTQAKADGVDGYR